LLPIAFGRQLLERIGVKVPTACTVVDGASRTSVDLQSSAIFRQASALALWALNEGTITRDEFIAIAARDASFNAVNQALHNGSKPQDLWVAPLAILWSEPEPLCPPAAAEPVPRGKPWWRVWG
jgi:hypothetical protein